MADNIIKFPNKILDENNSVTIEDFLNDAMLQILKEANDSSEYLWSNVILETNKNGFSLERNSEEIAAASIMILESIRSLHYLTKGLHHPLQEVALEIFSISTEE